MPDGSVGTDKAGATCGSSGPRPARLIGPAETLGLVVKTRGSYTESERLRPARAGGRCRGRRRLFRDVDGTQLALPRGRGRGHCDSHINRARSGAR